MQKLLSAVVAVTVVAAVPSTLLAEPAEFRVTEQVARPAEKMPPIGANDYGRGGSVEWAANNFVLNAGNEFPQWRTLHRVTKVNDDNSFEIEVGTSWFDLYGNGFLSGAAVRIYRLVDEAGVPVPIEGNYIDIKSAANTVLVGESQIVPEGADPAMPDGGWVATQYAEVFPLSTVLPTTTTGVDFNGPQNGRTYWYRVIAIGKNGQASEPSAEVSAVPKADAEKFAATQDKAATLDIQKAEGDAPAAPTGLKATAGNGTVKLDWTASTSPDIAGYKVYRSTEPAANQSSRIVLSKDAPKILPWDYIVVTKKFENFDMKWANTRVRGIGNPMNSPNYSWRGTHGAQVEFSFDKHDKNLPAEFSPDAGVSCLKAVAAAGEQSIWQVVFCGLGHGGETDWYGRLQPGKKYRAEVWMRQDGLDNGGAVKFSYGAVDPHITATWNVTDQWQKFTYDFEGPDEFPADKVMHYGHNLTFSGPGTLWFDNFTIRSYQTEADLAKKYVPYQESLDKLLASQPEKGRKGVHRIWFLSRDASMDSILSWYPNSKVRPDWSTGIEATISMPAPKGLTFTAATGDSPENRMRPWIVLQHILHTEQDWRNFIEYIAAPYDPAKDSPETKPYAARRVAHRDGNTTPWTNEFSEMILEFGNETWHNGCIEDWIGFSRFNAVWQGGKEYGLFSKYLIAAIKASPYWTSEKLDQKIRFYMGGGYQLHFDGNGEPIGYGEDAMKVATEVSSISQANYVGPKWETNDEAFSVLDDKGYQATLFGFIQEVEKKQADMSRARELVVASRGVDYDLSAYEGGPSGYPIPTMGRGTKEQAAIAEFYGKSIAMGVAALDAWLRSPLLGWTDQAFLGYAQGKMWSSHTTMLNGFRPHAGWLAMTLRNRHASGDLMAVEEVTNPGIDWAGTTLPAIGVSPFRDGEKWSIIVLSRSLNDTTPVKINLPFKKASKVTLHAIEGNPRAHNIEDEQVKITSQDLPATLVKDGILSIDMPPGCIRLYSIEK